MTLYDSNPIWTRLTDLAACLCVAIDDPDYGVPGVCFCGVLPGANIAAQYAGECSGGVCGMAWVRLSSTYRAKAVGAPDQTVGNCGSGVGIEVEVGIVRCMSVGDEQGNLPSPQEMSDATQLQVADIQVMWQAILCCDAINVKDVIVGPYTPIGPEGGIVGGTMTIATAV